MLDFSKCYLGIEFGSTRIKAVVINENSLVMAQGGFSWENRFENGHWTYSEDLILTGLRSCYASLLEDIFKKYSQTPTTFKAIGISAMMHGYLALDKDYNLLTPFRTWRDTTTGEAATELTQLFLENVPLRWSVSHLYQAVLNKEEHLKHICHFTTLAGFVHRLLTGENVLGVGDASGMFPVKNGEYDRDYADKFNALLKTKGYNFDILALLPKILMAGKLAGTLTSDGAKLLDKSGNLKGGIPFCAPEGDAGTGMVAVNAIKVGEGSISAGTSAFAMLVCNKKPTHLNRDVDLVCTPNGSDVAMIHQNNCCGELDKWVGLFSEFLNLAGVDMPTYKVYDLLYENTVNANFDCGGISAYNFISAEPILNVNSPCPALVRQSGEFNLANLFKAQIFSTVAPLFVGISDFEKQENIKVNNFKASGGIFKTEKIAQQIYADALNCTVTLTQTAGEGGAWGMAVLAQYLDNNHKPLDEWLCESVFKNSKTVSLSPSENGKKQFENYLNAYLCNLKERNICSKS